MTCDWSLMGGPVASTGRTWAFGEARGALALHQEAAAQGVVVEAFQLPSPCTPMARLVRLAHGAMPLNIRSPKGSGL